MTLSQFDRLAPTERDFWVAEWQYKRLECNDCGRPIDECSDSERKFYPFRRICYATMERDAAQEAYSALHTEEPWHDGTFTRWSKNRSRDFPYAAGSGISIGVADMDIAPWDEFTTKADASPSASLPEQPPREHPEANN